MTVNLKDRRRWFQIVRLLGIILFIVILTRIDLSAVWNDIQKISILFLLIGILFQVLLLFAKAMRWHLFNEESNRHSDIIRSFGEFFEGYAIGVFTPGRLGEIVKTGHKKDRDLVIASAIRFIVERGIDLGFFIGFAGLALMKFEIRDLPAIIGIFIFSGGVLLMVFSSLSLYSVAFLRLVTRTLLRIKLIRDPEGFSFHVQKPLKNAGIIFLSLISNMSHFVSCYFLAEGLGIEASFYFISGGVAIAGLFNLIPVTILGLGTREMTFLYIFHELPRSLVMAFSGMVLLVAQVGGGLISMLLGQGFLLAARKIKNH